MAKTPERTKTVARRTEPRAISQPTRADGGEVNLKGGAQRMVEVLGQMSPLRLTKSQWGTLAKMKTTSGTWSTYLSTIRTAGFLDEATNGFTLTEAGFDYIGGQPDPMDAEELRGHYLGILKGGASRMLQALLDAHPESLSREELGEQVGMSTASGTFSTYLSSLTSNGLAIRTDGGLVAADVLFLGAAS